MPNRELGNTVDPPWPGSTQLPFLLPAAASPPNGQGPGNSKDRDRDDGEKGEPDPRQESTPELLDQLMVELACRRHAHDCGGKVQDHGWSGFANGGTKK